MNGSRTVARRFSYSISTAILATTIAAAFSLLLRRDRVVEVEPLSAFDAAIKDEYAIVFVQLDWTPLERERDRFQQFANAYRKANPFHSTTFRAVNFTNSDGYAPLAKLPGWNQHDPGPNAHQINGVGEIIWLQNGRITGIGRLDEIRNERELLEMTATCFPSLFGA